MSHNKTHTETTVDVSFPSIWVILEKEETKNKKPNLPLYPIWRSSRKMNNHWF